jgi:4-amino-4-deoxy-L-arabinose transferase-like glycosyltransferase
MAALDRTWPAPATLVALFAAGQIVAWALAPALTHSAPPLDVVEGYMWGREWVIATYKHPALPSWVLEASRLLTGAVGWPAYLVSQLFVATAFLCVFLLGRDMMGPQRAAAGTLLLAGVAYYAWPTPEFNHNIAEVPFWAGLPLALWRAVERRRLVWWVLAGVLAAGCVYAKLSGSLLLVTAGVWLVLDARARASLATPGPWIALAVFAALTAPLAAWLVANDFAPLKYAAQRSGQRSLADLPLFVFNTLTNLVGMLAMLAAAGLLWRSRAAAPEQDSQAEPAVDERAVRFLAWLTAGPLVLAMIGAVVSGSGLKTAWGSSMFNLVGLLAIALAGDRFGPRALQRIGVFAGVLLVVVPLAYASVVRLGPRLTGAMLRVQWPQAEIAERLGAVWARETGRPLRIVTGQNWVAGLVGLTAKDRPSILNNGNFALSPWVTQSRWDTEGGLIVWDGRATQIPVALAILVGSRPIGAERFGVGRKGRELVINYVVVPPKPPRE